ncbi:isochorismatase family cysteine hydrolase [Cellulomonas sp. PhB150]|uniref:isochorismatase family cysteine hydrolase n=1 Tax=Cellulomonas sp. PhB150 TaxID=2485188 RepID=UPI000F494942|nr:isochorismatase family cysteine hydrolase [Cellulomonas sp. PhB150]ROS23981.1 nicotinamidase-related amidase [Cellulomonas sp. PhB150]
MALTTIDPTSALVVVDLQQVTTSFPAAHDMAGVVANATRLAESFRSAGRPVVLTVADLNAPPVGRTEVSRPRPQIPADALELVPGLQHEGDLVVRKRGWGAFAGTGLEEQLHGLGITQVVICGLATGFGVESTARAAYDAGFHVTLATDAMTGPVLAGHDHTVANVFRVLGETGSTDDVTALLAAGAR